MCAMSKGGGYIPEMKQDHELRYTHKYSKRVFKKKGSIQAGSGQKLYVSMYVLR